MSKPYLSDEARELVRRLQITLGVSPIRFGRLSLEFEFGHVVAHEEVRRGRYTTEGLSLIHI